MSRKPAGKRGNLSQFGLIDIPDLDNDEPLDLSDDDIDLEAELSAISGGSKPQRPKKPAAVPASDLDAMIAASLRDIPSDDEGSGDDDDPDLLNELNELSIDDDAPPQRTVRPAPPPPSSSDSSTVNLLQERISNYTIAEKSAKDKGDNTRARRYGRGLKTLHDLLKQARAGKAINDEDIPPAVSLPKPVEQAAEPEAPAPPARSTSITSTPETPTPPEVPPRSRQSFDRPCPPEPKEPPPILPQEDEVDPAKQEGLQFILKRKEEFKAAALASKHAGDKALALELLKAVKQFDLVVQAYKAGQEMDLNELPTPDAIAAAFKSQPAVSETQTSAGPEPEPSVPAGSAGLITASSVEEALKQRLQHFQEQESKAKEEGNSSKARRMGRIVKQYQDAVRLHAAGKPLPLDDLPTPNGFAPIPTGGSGTPSHTPSRPSPGTARPSPGAAQGQSAAPSPSPAPARRVPATNYQKQLALLKMRQKQFKDAAFREKKKGDLEKARQYLRSAKGFDSLIQAAEGGLPVDLGSLPLPPAASKDVEEAFDVVSAEDCNPPGEEAISPDDEDVLTRMAQQLTTQLRMCVANRDHYRAMGNVAEGNRFEQLALTVKQDLDVVKVAKRLKQDPPRFHYENRQFSIVQCNTELPDNVLHLTIVRGVAYNVPNPHEVDTYVKFDFAYPPEAPVSDRTGVVKDTSSPAYGAEFSLPIARSSRACLRFFRRHALKCEVYSRGGWFSRDTLLGTVAVKLAPLETQVTIHDSFPLMDGRKAAGGTLELRLRVRSPLGAPQVTREVHRWLLLDN